MGGNEKQYAAAHAVDKDLSTVARTHTVNGAGWLKLELERSYRIDKIIIYCMFYINWYNPSDYCAISVDNFKACVDYKNNVDVSVYQGKAKKKSCGTLQLTYGLEQSDQIYTLICDIEGDTVRLSRTTGGTRMCEVAVTGTGNVLLVLWEYGAMVSIHKSTAMRKIETFGLICGRNKINTAQYVNRRFLIDDQIKTSSDL